MPSVKWQLCCCSHSVFNLKSFCCVCRRVKYGLKLPEISFHCAVYSPRRQFSVTLNPRSHFSRLNGRKVQPLNPRDGGMKWTCLGFGLHVTVIINTTSNFLQNRYHKSTHGWAIECILITCCVECSVILFGYRVLLTWDLDCNYIIHYGITPFRNMAAWDKIFSTNFLDRVPLYFYFQLHRNVLF